MMGCAMRLRPFFTVICTIAATQLLMSQVVFGMGGSSDSTEVTATEPAEYTLGKKQIESQDWTGAIQSFSMVVEKNPKNADAFNYMGYASRKMGAFDKAFGYYEKALSINPNHRGANEYIGEAYLMTGNLKKAEEHLSRLDEICTFGCPEYTMLKRAVSDYKEKKS
jgi:tetratricopeptide (TPR) repeat protein